jgi:hypothetical protein
VQTLSPPGYGSEFKKPHVLQQIFKEPSALGQNRTPAHQGFMMATEGDGQKQQSSGPGSPTVWKPQERHHQVSSKTNVSAYTSNGSVELVTFQQVIIALRNAVCAIGKACLGISNEKISTRSIRSGAAMAMYLGKCLVYTIMLIGQWSSDAFLQYIRKQVMEFSHNVSKRMLTFQNYCHIPNFDHGVSAKDSHVRNDPNNAETRRNVSGDMSQLMQLPALSQFS